MFWAHQFGLCCGFQALNSHSLQRINFPPDSKEGKKLYCITFDFKAAMIFFKHEMWTFRLMEGKAVESFIQRILNKNTSSPINHQDEPLTE